MIREIASIRNADAQVVVAKSYEPKVFVFNENALHKGNCAAAMATPSDSS